MRHWRPITLALAAGLFALAWLGFRERRSEALEGRAAEAARRGAAWLSATDAELKDPGIPWIVSEIDGEYCREPRVAAWVETRFHEFRRRRHPIYLAMQALALGRKDETFDAFSDVWKDHAEKQDVVAAMAFGVFCDRMPRPAPVAETVRAADLTGYELTHQFLALLYMRENGCLSPAELEGLARAARAIAAEHAGDAAFSDLWAERVAVLLWGGFRELVEPAWIERLIEEQDAGGAWSDPRLPRRLYRTAENPHTTALAVWALAEYGRACPF